MATKYIKYELDENVFVNIPREEIERMMKGLGVTEDDACWIWCEDNGKIVNEEQEELDKKAKESRITATIHQARAETTKERKIVERKPDQVKDSLVESLKAFLIEQGFENVAITKVGKLVEFDCGGEHFKLDLIRQRPPKKK
jgi:hypothetical protein